MPLVGDEMRALGLESRPDLRAYRLGLNRAHADAKRPAPSGLAMCSCWRSRNVSGQLAIWNEELAFMGGGSDGSFARV